MSYALLPHLVDDHKFDQDKVYDATVSENLDRHRREHQEDQEAQDHTHGDAR